MDSDDESESALYILRLARKSGSGCNRLLTELCEYVNIHCVLVRGAVKGSWYRNGEKLRTSNDWCLVLIDGFWGLIDQNWGTVHFTKKWDADEPPDEKHDIEDYFLPPPCQFIYDHFPEEPEYQLLPRTVSAEEFRRMARLMTSYFQHNIVDLSQPECCLSTDTGETQLGFELREDSYLKFNYVLYCDYTDCSTSMVYILNEGDRKTVFIEFEARGTYLLDLEVIDVKNNPSGSCILASYLIKCTRPQFHFSPPVVDSDNPEFGPGADWKLLRIKADKQGGILEAQDGKVHLELLNENNDGIEYSFEIVGDDSNERPRSNIHYQRYPGGAKIDVRLSKPGKRLLKIYTKDKGLKNFRHTCNYMIKADKGCVEPFFSDEQLRIGQIGQHHDLEPVSHPDALISVGDTQNSLTITMKKLKDFDVSVEIHLHTDTHTEDASNHVLLHESGKDVSIQVKIPQRGMYDLILRTSPRSSVSNPSKSWRYAIEASKPSPDCLPFPRRLDGWSSRFLLHSPLDGTLEEGIEVHFDLETPGAAVVYAIQEDSIEKMMLNETSPGRFSKKIRPVSCSSLLIKVVFRRKNGERKRKKKKQGRKKEKGVEGKRNVTGDEKVVLEYKIVSSQDYKAIMEDKARELVNYAEERLKQQEKAKKQEEEDAKRRKAEAVAKAREEERRYQEEQKQRRAGTKSKPLMQPKTSLPGTCPTTFKPLEHPRKSMPELYSRSAPPEGLFNLIRALLLLLGENEERSKNWIHCHVQLRGMDVPRVTGNLRIRDVHPRIAARINEMVGKSPDENNKSATYLHAWLEDCVTKLRSKCHGVKFDGAKPATVEEQKKILKDPYL